MRLFVALTFPKKERERIYRAARPLREADLPVQWSDPDNFHLTLKVLGDVNEAKIEAVERGLEKVAGSTRVMDIEFSGFGAFPTIRRPRVVWVAADPTPALRCLKQDIEWALADCGFERETRAFHPHITLGKAEETNGAGAFRGLDELAAGLSYQGMMKVRKLHLMRSQTSSAGTQYSIHRSLTLEK